MELSNMAGTAERIRTMARRGAWTVRSAMGICGQRKRARPFLMRVWHGQYLSRSAWSRLWPRLRGERAYQYWARVIAAYAA